MEGKNEMPSSRATRTMEECMRWDIVDSADLHTQRRKTKARKAQRSIQRNGIYSTRHVRVREAGYLSRQGKPRKFTCHHLKTSNEGAANAMGQCTQNEILSVDEQPSEHTSTFADASSNQKRRVNNSTERLHRLYRTEFGVEHETEKYPRDGWTSKTKMIQRKSRAVSHRIENIQRSEELVVSDQEVNGIAFCDRMLSELANLPRFSWKSQHRDDEGWRMEPKQKPQNRKNCKPQTSSCPLQPVPSLLTLVDMGLTGKCWPPESALIGVKVCCKLRRELRMHCEHVAVDVTSRSTTLPLMAWTRCTGAVRWRNPAEFLNVDDLLPLASEFEALKTLSVTYAFESTRKFRWMQGEFYEDSTNDWGGQRSAKGGMLMLLSVMRFKESLVHLNLRGNGLKGYFDFELIAELGECHRLRHLNLADNMLGRGHGENHAPKLRALSTALKGVGWHLDHLDVSHNDFDDVDWTLLSDGIQKCSALKHLDLCESPGRDPWGDVQLDAGARCMIAALARSGCRLEFCNLSDSGIVGHHAVELAALLRSAGTVTDRSAQAAQNLRFLGLAGTDLSTDEAQEVVKLLKASPACLDFSRNRLVNAKVVIDEAIQKCLDCKLSGLVLQQTDWRVRWRLGWWLPARWGSNRLERIDLREVSIQPEDCCAALQDLTRDLSFAHLREISLKKLPLRPSCLQILCASLDAHMKGGGRPALESVNLSGCPAAVAHGSTAFDGLLTALSRCPCLKTLKLKSNQIVLGAHSTLVALLPRFSQLQNLKLGDNRVGNVGACALASRLLECRTLVRLDLACNRIGAAGVEALAHAIEHRASTGLGQPLALNLRLNSITAWEAGLLIGLLDGKGLCALDLSNAAPRENRACQNTCGHAFTWVPVVDRWSAATARRSLLRFPGQDEAGEQTVDARLRRAAEIGLRVFHDVDEQGEPTQPSLAMLQSQ